MTKYNNRRRFPYSQTKKTEFFEGKLLTKAESILETVYDGELSMDEIISLSRAIREYYLDRDNYPRAFNLRIARKFDAYDLNEYYGKARKGYRKFYDTTIHTKGSDFYFGFNHN